MATHSSIVIGKIPWTKEPDGVQSIGSQKVGHAVLEVWELEMAGWNRRADH